MKQREQIENRLRTRVDTKIVKKKLNVLEKLMKSDENLQNTLLTITEAMQEPDQALAMIDSLSSLTNALRVLTDVTRDLYNKPNERERQGRAKLALDREWLKLEQAKNNTETDGGLQIIIRPPEEDTDADA